MNLVIQLYLYEIENEIDQFRRAAKQIRQHEIDECFLRNLHHPLLKIIHVLCENERTKTHYESLAKQFGREMKCMFILFGRQPYYSDLVQYVEKSIPSNEIVCIQNSDIYIDHGLSKEFLDRNLTDDTVIALTRHEHTDETHQQCDIETCPLIWNYMGSHDTFFFKTPIPKDFPYETLHYNQNVYGGETYFMKAWKDCGKKLFNPCFDVRIFHRHRHRITFSHYPTIAEGDLCHINPSAPEGREDIARSLQSIYTD